MKTEQENNRIVEIKNLYKSFGSNKVLSDFSMELKQGQSLAVLGKSGSGKSVLIKCMVGLMQPDSGMVKIFNNDIPSLNHADLDEVRMKIGFLFQSNALYDSMTVRENLEFPLRRHSINANKKEMDDMVLEALENVGLEHTIDMMPSELSGGMRKRISIARTLILKPKLILYDEPTTGLDPITSREISRLMVSVQEKYNTSSVIISHDLNCIKISAEQVVMLIDGKNYQQGTYNELEKSGDLKVKQFFD